jgi:hypothetical protein
VAPLPNHTGGTHITFERKRLAERTWGIGDVHAAISRPVAEFVPMVPPERVIPNWHHRVWQTIPGFGRGREHFSHPPRIVPTQTLPPRG